MDRLENASQSRRSGSEIVRFRVVARALAVCVVILLCVLYAFSRSAGILVLNRPKPADVILVMNTDPYRDDLYYYRAAGFLANHYGKYLVLPADATGDPGHTEADEARAFVQQTAGAMRDHVFVCPVRADEFHALDKCLDRFHARKVLMVAPAPESRRCFMRYKAHLPQYSWSVAAVEAPAVFEDHWWSNRRWAKAYIEGLQHLIYAELSH